MSERHFPANSASRYGTLAERSGRSAAALLLACLMWLPAAAGQAQEREREGFDLEEIVVTARKREEALQDVPLSITAFDAEAIEGVYGNDLSEFSKYAPNVLLTRQPYAGNAILAGIRGIVFGDLEKSFDPAVGVVVDGVALVNNTGALIDTFDLESIEILRGPQGSLFGRNTVGGVVNVRRSRPTGEMGLKTQYRYGSYEETDFRAVLNMPIGDTLSFKLAGFLDRGDGFQEHADVDLVTGDITPTGEDIEGEKTWNVYASLYWQPNEDFDALLTVEYIDDESTLATPVNMTTPNLTPEQWDEINADITPDTVTLLGPPYGLGILSAGGLAVGKAIADTLGASNPMGRNFGADGNFCDVYGAVISRAIPGSHTQTELACARYGWEFAQSTDYKYSVAARRFENHIDQTGISLELNYDIGDYTLTSVMSYKESDEVLDQDNLGSPVEMFNPYRPQTFDQFSGELRLQSERSGVFNFVAGLYFVESDYYITQSIYGLGQLAGTRESGASPNPDGDAGQKLQAFAVFGETYWDITESTRLTLGGRWTTEQKEFFIFQRVSGDTSGLLPAGAWGCGNLSAAQRAVADAARTAHLSDETIQAYKMDPDNNPLTPGTDDRPVAEIKAAREAALVCNDADGKEDWNEFTPRFSIDHRLAEDVMVYASWSRGFRSGGWNGRATTPTSMGPYQPETVDSYEVGLKSEWWDNRLQVNLTYFRAEYQDKHENEIYQFGAATETVVNNAAEAILQGVELEMNFVPVSDLLLRLSGGWLDAEYDEFLAPPADNRGDRSVRVDRSDDFELTTSPEWSYNVGVNYQLPTPVEWGRMTFAANYAWSDDTFGNFGQPDPAGLGRHTFESRGEADFSLIWENEVVDIAVFVKDAFHSDNYLANSVDVGVFWFGAVSPGRTWGVELTRSWF